MFPEFNLSERYQEIYPGVGFGLTLISSCREADSPEGLKLTAPRGLCPTKKNTFEK